MASRKSDRELKRVVDRALRLVPAGRAIPKPEFEAVHAEVLACVAAKTGATAERLGPVANKVLAEFPGEYGRLPEWDRTWPALIRCLYTKYLRELAAGQ